MKKRILGTLLMGALFVASMSTFVSCKDYDDEINDLQAQINSLSSLVDQKENSIKSTISTLESTLNGTISSLETKLTGKITDGDAATLAAAKQAVADAKAELEKAIKANSDAIAANKAGIDANKADIAAIILVNTAQDEAIIRAQQAADQALSQIAALEATVKTLATKAELEAAKTELQTALNGALADIATLKGQVATANTEITDLKTKYNTLDGKMTTAIGDIASLKIALNSQKAALEALTAQDGAITKAQADIQNLLGRVTTLEATVTDLATTQAQKVAQQISDVDQKVEDLKAAFESYQGEVASALSKVENDINEINTVKIPALQGEIAAVNVKYEIITNALAKTLRGLVYMPYLYVDGIETIEYPYLCDTAKAVAASYGKMTRQRTATGYAEDYAKEISEAEGKYLAPLRDYLPKLIKGEQYDTEYFGLVAPVQYHMNPAKATTTWANVQGFNKRNAEIVTRSDAQSGIKAVDTYVNGENLFSNVNGVLTVGLRVDNPHLLANHAQPTEAENGRPGYLHEGYTYDKNGKGTLIAGTRQFDDMVALQVKAPLTTGTGADTLITSDYAMVYPEKLWLESIVWTDQSLKGNGKQTNFDEPCAQGGKFNHVWDTPKKALGVEDATVYPDVELYYNDKDGIKLADYLGIHFVKEGKTLSAFACKEVKFGSTEFNRLGLSYEFQLVGYSIDGNKTIDSNYAEFTDADDKGVSKTGTIRARNVKEDGVTIDTESATSVNREPLVRVLVKRGDRVVLDGYILVHITKLNPAKPSTTITDYPEGAAQFDLCNGVTAMSTTWSQFSKWVLTDALHNLDKVSFDAQYGAQVAGVPDLSGAAAPVTLADNGFRYDNVQIYKDTKGTKATAADFPGQIRYYYNSVGTTNHRFDWVMTADELEYYTQHNPDMFADPTKPVQVTKYFRYTGKDGSEFAYVYVKVTVNLTRAKIAASGIQDKNTNYWFANTGADEGWDAVIWNPWYPQNGGNTKVYRQNLGSTFAGGNNRPNLTNEAGLVKDVNKNINERGGVDYAKYYFIPKNFEITSLKGVKYTITAQSSANDTKWNSFVCKYGKDAKKYGNHVWNDDPAKNAAILEQCAIDYNDGMFTNNALYAVTNYGKANAVYTKIATLNQNIDLGTMDLIWDESDTHAAKEVLNAVGYADNHANVLAELHTMVGVVSKNSCDVAVKITELVDGQDNKNAGTFYVSWQRPINVAHEAKPMVDAKNNGDYIYTMDFVKLYDWRGPEAGYMYGDQQWLWAYYNVKGLKLDTRAAYVKTNMHQADGKFVALNKVTTQAQLGVFDAAGNIKINDQVEFNFNLLNYVYYENGCAQWTENFNSSLMNAKLLQTMGIYPVSNTLKKTFAGGLFYANNGDNVEQFDVLVPVTIVYDWGEFPSEVLVHIDRTLGN